MRLVPGKVGNLVCASSSSPSELSFSWDLPTLLGAEVVSYQVLVNRLEHRTGTTRGVTQSGVYNKFVDTQAVSVIGLGKIIRGYCRIIKKICVSLLHIACLQLLRCPTTSQ